MVMKKSDSLYERDEKGKLIPIEVKLEIIDETDPVLKNYIGETIRVIPMPRGKIKRIFADVKEDNESDMDGEIILEQCVEPKYTKDELVHIKPALASAIVNTVLRESGLDVGKSRKKALLEAEDEFAKN